MVVLDRFSGGNDPEGWLLRAEQYFTHLGFSEQDWLPLSSFYLDGEALTWFNWLFRNKQFYDWKHFMEKLLIRFPQRTFMDSVRMADTSRGCIDYMFYTTPVSTHRSTGISPSTFSSFSNLQTPVFHKPSNRLLDGHTYATAVDKVFDANPQKSVELSNEMTVNSASEDGNSEAAHMFDEMPIGVLEDNFSVTQVSPSTDGPKSGIVDDMVFEDNSHNNAIVFQSHFESLQTEVTVATIDNTIGISSHFVPITTLVVPTGYIVNPQLDSKHEDEGNTGNEVARVAGISPLRDKTGYSVVFANQVSFLSNAFWRLMKIDFSFDGVLWLIVFPYFHISLDKFCWGSQNRESLYLDFCLHKCNWVDTGQECILLGFLLSDLCAYENCNVLAFTLSDVTWLGQIIGSITISLRALSHSTSVRQSEGAASGETMSKEFTISLQGKKIVTALYLEKRFSQNEVSISTNEMHSVDVLLNAEHGQPTGRFDDQLNLNQFLFDPGVKFVTVPIRLTAIDLYVWDLRISFTFMALTGYIENIEEILLFGCPGKFFLIAYSNTMSRVWDPGQPKGWYGDFLALKYEDLGSVKIVIESGSIIHNCAAKLLYNEVAMDRREILCLGYAAMDLNSIALRVSSALPLATITEYVKALHFFVSLRRALVMSTSQGWAPLHFAAHQGQREGIGFLLNNFNFQNIVATNHGNCMGYMISFGIHPIFAKFSQTVWLTENMLLLDTCAEVVPNPYSSLDISTAMISLLFYVNLEDKVLIDDRGIVMNGPGPLWAKQPNTEVRDYVWDPG